MGVILDIYTDGSLIKWKNKAGYGYYAEWMNEDGTRQSREKGDKIKLSRYSTYKISQVECAAIAFALTDIIEYANFKNIEVEKINVLTDSWDALYIIEGNGTGMSLGKKGWFFETIKNVTCEIEYFHCKGHSGIYGNERADKNARWCARHL